AAVAPGRPNGRPDRRLRRHDRPEPARRPPPDLVEAAHRRRLDDGPQSRLRGRLRAGGVRPSATGRRLRLPAPLGPDGARAARERRTVRQGRLADLVRVAAGRNARGRPSREHALTGGDEMNWRRRWLFRWVAVAFATAARVAPAAQAVVPASVEQAGATSRQPVDKPIVPVSGTTDSFSWSDA